MEAHQEVETNCDQSFLFVRPYAAPLQDDLNQICRNDSPDPDVLVSSQNASFPSGTTINALFVVFFISWHVSGGNSRVLDPAKPMHNVSYWMLQKGLLVLQIASWSVKICHEA